MFDELKPLPQLVEGSFSQPLRCLRLGRLVTSRIPAAKSLGRFYSGKWSANPKKTIQRVNQPLIYKLVRWGGRVRRSGWPQSFSRPVRHPVRFRSPFPCFFGQVLSQLGELAHSARQASYSRRRPKPHPLDACRFLASSSSIVELCRRKDLTRSLHLARGQVALPNRSANPHATARMIVSAFLAFEI